MGLFVGQVSQLTRINREVAQALALHYGHSNPDKAGSQLELTAAGRRAITLRSGERLTFLGDGDTVSVRTWCERSGAGRIGFGEVLGEQLLRDASQCG